MNNSHTTTPGESLHHIAYFRFGGPAHGVKRYGGAHDHPLWAETLCGRMTQNEARIFVDWQAKNLVTCKACRRAVTQ